jgi:D-lactate dehydrogenase
MESQLASAWKAKYEALRIFDSIAWCRDLLPDLPISRSLKPIAVHPTCSINHLGLADALRHIASQLAEEVEVPIGTTCCGTAGDRGLLHPELVRWATREIRSVLDANPAEAYVSANRTCEIGLRHVTGRPYESFIYLLEELSRTARGF